MHMLEWLLDGEALGTNNRIVLPACIVNNIRPLYPSEDGLYVGFKWPRHDLL